MVWTFPTTHFTFACSHGVSGEEASAGGATMTTKTKHGHRTTQTITANTTNDVLTSNGDICPLNLDGGELLLSLPEEHRQHHQSKVHHTKSHNCGLQKNTRDNHKKRRHGTLPQSTDMTTDRVSAKVLILSDSCAGSCVGGSNREVDVDVISGLAIPHDEEQLPALKRSATKYQEVVSPNS